MNDFTHVVVRTVGEDGKSRTVLLDIETASMLTQGRITQMVSAGRPDAEIPEDIQRVLCWDLGGMKKALAEAEARGILTEHSSLEEIQKYLEEYQARHGLDFGIPKLT